MAVRYNGRRPFSDYFNKVMDDTYFEINGRMIGLLPKFIGTNEDNPLTYLRDLHFVCNALRPREALEADFMLRMFLHSLIGNAKSWLFSLDIDSYPTWDHMRHLFLKEYLVKRHPGELTFEYYERFRDFLLTCLNHSLPEHVLILCFLDGLTSVERRYMDIMAGGSILDCSPEEAWSLAEELAAIGKEFFMDKVRQPAQTNQQTKETIKEAFSEIADKDDPQEMATRSQVNIKEREEEEFVQDIDVMDEALHVVPTAGNEATNAETCKTEPCVQSIAQPAAENTGISQFVSSQYSHPITKQSIVVHIPNVLQVPNILLSSQVQEVKHQKALDKKKIRSSLDKVTIQSPLVHAYKQKHKNKRSLDEVCVNWKTRKKAKRATINEEDSSFFVPLWPRHNLFRRKSGLDSCSSAHHKATKKVGRCWKKFDGAHPWAPNI